MNAKERKRLIGAIETYLPLEYREPILRALRLLAAAEANDGSTPLTDALVMNGPLTFGTQRAADAYDAAIDHSRTLEVERTGLAARVLELEGERDSATTEALYGYKEMRDEVMRTRGLLHECAMALRDEPMSKRAFSKDRLLAAIAAARSAP